MSIQTLENNRRLYNFIMDKQETKNINFLMKNNYSGNLMFNGILPLELEVFILELNGYKYDWNSGSLNNCYNIKLYKQLSNVKQKWSGKSFIKISRVNNKIKKEKVYVYDNKYLE